MINFYIPRTKKIILTGFMLSIYILLDRVLTINSEVIKVNIAMIAVIITAIILRS